MNKDELTALFRQLGARDPEAWAGSQLQEGLPQLARFLFLRQAWRRIVPEGDSIWIDDQIERARTHLTAPYAGIGLGLQKLRDLGVADATVIIEYGRFCCPSVSRRRRPPSIS